jgi:hypothetical protein
LSQPAPDDFILQLASTSNSPLAFTTWAYPWEEGGELESESGPDTWQLELFSHIESELARGQKVIRVAIKSGHGVGKSAGSSMLIDWAMSTFEGCKGVVTANTERQLRTKTWVELSKWRRLSLTRDLFKLKATSLFSNDPEQKNEWRFDMAPWSERNTEAFAGLHNKGKRLLLIMDEASGIPDIVWEVAEGAMTDEDTQIIWIVLGNPTKNTGRFRECFDDGRFAHRWKQITVDSRTSRFTDKELINQWIEDYGLDHDFVRVRVLGQFPKHDVSSFISRADVLSALQREPPSGAFEPVVIGVDPARYGDDSTVLFPRQGRDGKSRPIERYQGLGAIEIADRVAAMFNRYRAEMIYVDGTGVGGGVVDALRSMGYPVHEVTFNAKASSFAQATRGVNYKNKRAEIWGEMREWLRGAALQNFIIDKDYSILDDLTSTQFYFDQKDQIQLEAKDEIKRREGRSPDIGDALAVTFALPSLHQHTFRHENTEVITSVKYNPYEKLRRNYA